MKTKHQKRSEALQRREEDLSVLREISTYCENLPVGSKIYVGYNLFRIFTYDPIDEEEVKMLMEFNPKVKIITLPEAESFWQRKIKAAETDIQNLKAKLA